MYQRNLHESIRKKTIKTDKNMKTNKFKEYIAPQVKIVEVIVEKGFAISAIIFNDRLNKEGIEKHKVDEVETW